MKQSASLIEQALGRLKPGPVLTDDRKVALPPRLELARSMEAVIHQFKLVAKASILRPENCINVWNQPGANSAIIL